MPRDPEAVVRGFIDVIWNQGQIDQIGGYVAETYVVDGMTVGPGWVVENFQAFRQAFADVNVVVEQLIANDLGQVSALMRLQGRHVASWKGIPASGQRVDYREAGFWLVEDGKIVSGDFVADTLSLRVQLGQVPESVWRGAMMVESSI